MVRVVCLPFFSKLSVRSPFIKPNQLRYTSTFSSASTAATESSQSWMVVTAASIKTSLMPAGSSLPTWLDGSIWISACKPLFFSKIPVGFAASPRKPTNFSGWANEVVLSPWSITNLPSSTLKPVTSAYLPSAKAKLASKKFLAYFTTSPPRTGL